METATATLIAEIVKAGLGYTLAGYFYLQLLREQKDRRACDDKMQTLLLSLKDESHTRVQDANNRQTETFAKVGDALAALTTEVRSNRCKSGGAP